MKKQAFVLLSVLATACVGDDVIFAPLDGGVLDGAVADSGPADGSTSDSSVPLDAADTCAARPQDGVQLRNAILNAAAGATVCLRRGFVYPIDRLVDVGANVTLAADPSTTGAAPVVVATVASGGAAIQLGSGATLRGVDVDVTPTGSAQAVRARGTQVLIEDVRALGTGTSTGLEVSAASGVSVRRFQTTASLGTAIVVLPGFSALDVIGGKLASGIAVTFAANTNGVPYAIGAAQFRTVDFTGGGGARVQFAVGANGFAKFATDCTFVANAQGSDAAGHYTAGRPQIAGGGANFAGTTSGVVGPEFVQ